MKHAQFHSVWGAFPPLTYYIFPHNDYIEYSNNVQFTQVCIYINYEYIVNET